MTAELPGGAHRLFSPSSTDLGNAVVDALMLCRYEAEFNYRDRKRTDWPAYQASAERTVKGFEAAWLQFAVRGANTANINWQIEGPDLSRMGLRLKCGISASKEPNRLGALLKYVAESHELIRGVDLPRMPPS